MISNANDGRRLKQKGPRCLLPVLFVLVVTMVTAIGSDGDGSGSEGGTSGLRWNDASKGPSCCTRRVVP